MRLTCLALVLLALPATAQAASFDCAKAETPFEKAICENDALSLADERLAKSFATATGGLTKENVSLMRADQRGWLDFAQRACTDDAQPITTGSYDADQSACLVDIFGSRSTGLEISRMQGGHRFLIKSVFGALPDPDEVDNDESYWKVAKHELVLPLLDADDPLAEPFNAWVMEQADGLSDTMALAGGGEVTDLDGSSDTGVTISVKELGGRNRITLAVDTYWYGHGAAHGNYSHTYLHYYVPEGRTVEASDIFTGDNWQGTLVTAAWDQLQTEHKEWLQVESEDDIAEVVVNPERWDFSNDYGLIIQFQPYEFAAYAYGAPTVTIPWERLDSIKADSQEDVRYGW
jgi:uncharacterized protein YecT (DUF1311 family)